MKREMHIIPDRKRPWMVFLNFNYHPQMVDFVKAVPGATWIQNEKVWTFPGEMTDTIREYAEKQGYRVLGKWQGEAVRTITPEFLALARPEGIHDYQWRAVEKAVRNAGHLYNDETGLGKGREVIETLKLLSAERIIVVCPAQARLVWHNPKIPDKGEFDKWWADHKAITVLEPGKKVERAVLSPIVVVSYEMLPKLLDVLSGPGPECDAIVVDECHYLQNIKAARTQAVKRLVERFPKAFRAWMTATLATNRPDTMGTPMNLLFPGRFETPWKFAARYMKQTVNDGGFTEFVLIEDEDVEEHWRIKELADRVARISSRTTKREVAHLLPAFITKLGWINPKRRVESSREWAYEKLSEANKICLLTHLRETAESLAAENYPKGVEVICITGADSHQERAMKLQRARDAKRAIICATLHSVNVAIDMTFCTVVGFAEIYSRPADMIQVLGRFSRLSGRENVEVTIFASEMRDDGAEQLMEKIEAINKIIKAGQSEHGLSTALTELKQPGLSADDFDRLLGTIAANYNPEIKTQHEAI